MLVLLIISFIFNLFLLAFNIHIINHWSKMCDDLNDDWADHCIRINDGWADFCEKIIKEKENDE